MLEMGEMGEMRPSTSPFMSPIAMVKKKDGSNSVCVDFRKLNKITEEDPESMMTSEDLFCQTSGKKYLSKDMYKTMFVTPDGQYEFLQMPFG